MTTFDYSRSVATATRLLARFGTTATIRRTSTTGGDPWNPTTTTTDYSATVVVLTYAKREIDGTLIRQTDKKVFVSTSGLSITPQTGMDVLIVGGETLNLINVSPLKPAGTVVLYETQARV